MSPKMSARSGVEGNKNILAPFGAISCMFPMGRINQKKTCVFAVFLGGSIGPIHSVWGGYGGSTVSFETCFLHRKSKNLKSGGRAAGLAKAGWVLRVAWKLVSCFFAHLYDEKVACNRISSFVHLRHVRSF